MKICADCHTHLYPNIWKRHSLEKLLEMAASRLISTTAPEITPLLCLTETAQCHVFEDAAILPGVKILEKRLLSIDLSTSKQVLLLDGKQSVSAERIEVVLLGCSLRPAEGLSLDELWNFSEEQGALLGFSWAPGKWLGRRGTLIENSLHQKRCHFLCDVPMRPQLLPPPTCFALARKQGIPVLCGSDPLPMLGEESLLGSAGVTFEVAQLGLGSIFQALRTPLESFGTPGSILNSATRWIRFMSKMR